MSKSTIPESGDLSSSTELDELTAAKSPQKRLASPRSPEGAPMFRWSKRVCLQSTEASDNGGPQKLCVELRRYNHPAPQKSPLQPNQRNWDTLQPRSQQTRKRALDTAGLGQVPPQKLCVELRRYNHPAPQKSPLQPNQRNRDRLQPRSQQTRKRALDTAGLRQVPPKKLWWERRCYNHQDPEKSPSQPNQRNWDRFQPRSQPTRKRALDTAGLGQVPPKKLWLERRRYNHQDPEKSPSSQPNRRNRDTHQPRSQPTRKRALDDSARVEISQPQKLQMAIKSNSQRSGPGIFDQIEDLCCIFAKSCVI